MATRTDTEPATGAEGTAPETASPREARPVTAGAAGWRVVARKEFADHVRSVRFVIVLALLGLTAVGAVYAAAGQIRDVAPQASGSPSLFLRLFTIQIENTPFAFFNFVSLVGPLLGIAFGFDAINTERSQRTLPRLLCQPVHRDDVVNGKFVAGLSLIAVTLTALTVIVAGVGIFRLGIVPTASGVARLLVYLVVSVLYIGVWLALALLFSTLFRRAATSVLVALGIWLVLSLFWGLIVGVVADAVAPVTATATQDEVLRNASLQQNLGRISPGDLYEEVTSALLTPELRSLGAISPLQNIRAVPSQLPLTQSLLLVWPQVAVLVAITVALFAGAYVKFLREEVRA